MSSPELIDNEVDRNLLDPKFDIAATVETLSKLK
jgi:hypothetical protein